MIYNYITVFGNLVFGIFVKYCNLKKHKPRLHLAITSLLDNHSHRLPDYQKEDAWILLRVLKRSLHKVWTGSVQRIQNERFDEGYNQHLSTAIITGHISDFPIREKHIEKFTGIQIGYFISIDTLLNTAQLFHKLIHTVAIIVLSFFLLPTLFIKNRANYALLLFEVPEAVNLFYFIRQHKIKAIFHFNCYEKSCDFNTYILMNQDVKVNKIGQILPLSATYKKLLANIFYVFYKYQEEELQHYKTIYIDKHEYLPAHMLFNLGKEFVWDTDVQRTGREIGYYSSGLWLRHKLGTYKQDIGEEELFNGLVEYVKKNPYCKLLIFLHPKEKNPKHEALRNEYYAPFLQNPNVSIVDIKTNTYDSFHLVDIAVTNYSSVGFERMYFGYKTMFYNPHVEDIFSQPSTFRNLFITNKEELFEKLSKNIPLEPKQFFEQNGLGFSDYTYHRYPQELLKSITNG